MIRFVIKRLLLTILVIVGAALIIFTLMFFVPGDPVELMMEANSTAAEKEAKRSELGLDRPYMTQLGDFMYKTFIKFDLGDSWFRSTTVLEGLGERLPRTLLLGVITACVIVLVGIPLGVSAARHNGKLGDKSLIVGTMVFTAIPEFWMALLLIIVFSTKLNWLPSMGIESWKCYILPVISGSIIGICNVARQTRASMLDVFRADFITTARAKGLRENATVYKHMLPNALIPIITIAGKYFSQCIGGTIVLEKIFSFPGVGLYLNDAIGQRDYPIIRGCVIVMAAFTAIVMLIVDLAYGFADPRIKAQYVNSGKRKGNHHRHHHRKNGAGIAEGGAAL